jgi:hypothetical protein
MKEGTGIRVKAFLVIVVGLLALKSYTGNPINSCFPEKAELSDCFPSTG